MVHMGLLLFHNFVTLCAFNNDSRPYSTSVFVWKDSLRFNENDLHVEPDCSCVLKKCITHALVIDGVFLFSVPIMECLSFIKLMK